MPKMYCMSIQIQTVIVIMQHEKPGIISVDEIRKQQNFTTLRYFRLDDLLDSIGIEPCKVCTYCFNGKE